MSRYQRGYELIAAMQPDAGNELLGDLDGLTGDSWTKDEQHFTAWSQLSSPRM